MTLLTTIKKSLPESWKPHVRQMYFFLFPSKRRPTGKGYHELGFWEMKKRQEGTLSHDHYQHFYIEHFGFAQEDFCKKNILDVGCGPRGSLEWANMCQERVGLDPLARYYERLGTSSHHMRYVSAPAEAIPFGDGHFDFVYSFNSLDHVDHLETTIDEIIRVLKPGGYFLLLTDVNHHPTPTEPISFSWDITEAFTRRGLRQIRETRFERVTEGLYQSIHANSPYREQDLTPRYGVLSAAFTKPSL